jgi:MFS family permease
MHAWAPSVLMLTWARVIFGAGQSAAFAAINRVARTWFPLSIRTTVQGWMGIFFARAGGASANLLFATVLMGLFLFSWQAAIYVFAGIGVLFAVLFLLFFRNSPGRHPWVNEQEATLIEGEDQPAGSAQRMTAREMLQRMSPRSILNLLCLNVQSTLSTIADNVYSNWMPLFLFQVHKLNYKEMGIYSSLPLIGGAIGGAVGGYLNDYLIRRTNNRRWSRRGVAIAGKTLAGLLILLAVLFLYDEPYLFCGLLFFVKFYSDWSLTTGWGTVTDIGGRATASVFAFNNSVASIGIVLAPLIYGYVAQVFGWQWVFVVAAIFCFLCALSWLFIDCTLPILRERS